MKKDGVSICITAYKAQEFIKECLDSVINQTWFKTHNEWEIIVGIDGCEETLEYVKSIMSNYKNLRVLMMDSNKGTYITTNTIMKEAKYENLFRFDSDDIMCPNLVETIMNKKEDYSYVRYKLKNFGSSNKVYTACGTVYLTKTLFEKCGGFRPWSCSADDEFYCRIKFDEKTKVLDDILMYRRCHPNSLTRSKETGLKSEKRRPYREIVQKMKNSNEPIVDFKIECVTNTFKEIKIENENEEMKEKYIETLPIKDWSNELYKDTKEENTIVRTIKPESINERYSKIIQLRKDIANGKIIKVYVGDGKFVWKRIK